MKTTRILALPAIAAAALLTLTGCFQLPPVGGAGTDTSTEGGTPTEDGDTAPAEEQGGDDTATGADLADTTWTGADMGPGFATMDFLLNSDGTIDITTWNDGSGFDSPNDTWSGDGSNLTMIITQLTDQNSESEPFDVTFTGTAEDGQLSLTGQAPDGEWTLTATEG